VVTLALFVPLLIGTGGNTGNQAATTVTRALALRDVAPRDIARVMAREFQVGLSLGVILGSVGYVLTSLIFDRSIGLVIGLTLLSVCKMAATVGGMMPLLAKAIRADPAVFSNPFITTFVDATGLLIYFLIAKAILHI
jgi:magnesium transporter